MRSGRIAGLALLVALLAGCGMLQPSPEASTTPEPNDAALGVGTPFPPPAVRNSMAQRLRIELAPLNPAEWAQVGIGPADAIRTALSNRAIGVPGPNGVGEIAWTQIGFIYLASYTPRDLPGYGGPRPDPAPFPAYLVQVLAGPFPGFPGENTALVIVDARSGEMGTTYGPCVGALCGPP
jgi:hypothetical protein